MLILFEMQKQQQQKNKKNAVILNLIHKNKL